MTERRRNPLTGEWVLVSAARLARPWGGEMTAIPARVPAWSAECHLCPRNRRAGGACNPDYEGTFVFANDYPALTDGGVARDDALFRSELTSGACRVLCYSPRHDLSLGELAREE